MEVEMAQDLQIPRVKTQKELMFQFESKGWGKPMFQCKGRQSVEGCSFALYRPPGTV